MKWFRVHGKDVVDSPKVQMLTDALFKFWVNVLCLASEMDGVVPPVNRLAFKLHIPEAKAKRQLSELVNAKLIDEVSGSLAMHDWDKWQYNSGASTERVRRHRERLERFGNVTERVTETDDETDDAFPKRFSNVSDAFPKRFRRNVGSVSESVSVSVSEEGSVRGDWNKPASLRFFREEFWPIVWLKVGRGAAEKAWLKKVTSREMAIKLKDAAISQGSSITARGQRDGSSTLHPATWINGERFEDEPESLPLFNGNKQSATAIAAARFIAGETL
jgi:hypothetical protein